MGDVTEEIVTLAQEYINERCMATEGRPARAAPHPNPRLSEPAKQKLRGEEPQFTGVRHTRHRAHELRKKCKTLLRRLEKARKCWKRGQPCIAALAWTRNSLPRIQMAESRRTQSNLQYGILVQGAARPEGC